MVRFGVFILMAGYSGVNGSASDVDESGDSDGADDSEGDAAEDGC
jgi:hypothetical protein